MCPFKPFKMVARSCILLSYIPLENIEASEDFQVLRKKNSFLLLPIVWLWEFAMGLI